MPITFYRVLCVHPPPQLFPSRHSVFLIVKYAEIWDIYGEHSYLNYAYVSF